MSDLDTVNHNLEEVKEKLKPNASSNIFNIMREKYMSKMSKEDIQSYEEFGKKFFNFDFVNSGEPMSSENTDQDTEQNTEQNTNQDTKQKTNKPKEINLEECVANITKQLQSGLHPRYLTQEETNLMIAAYGDEWYSNFNYKQEDL